MTEWIPEADWTTVVESVPIVSVDLVVTVEDGPTGDEADGDGGRHEVDGDGGRHEVDGPEEGDGGGARTGVVLARRTNEPAAGEWFVPGGRVRKSERILAAVDRVAATELGVEVSVEEYLGPYDHFYETSDVGDDGKHYVAHGYHVTTTETPTLADDQHEAMAVFTDPPADCHEYVEAYLRAAGVLGY